MLSKINASFAFKNKYKKACLENYGVENYFQSDDFKNKGSEMKEKRNVTCLKSYGREDILIILGGVIPKQDYKSLLKNGVSAIFGPGSKISETAIEILNLLIKHP